jgi:hypothetical protein
MNTKLLVIFCSGILAALGGWSWYRYDACSASLKQAHHDLARSRYELACMHLDALERSTQEESELKAMTGLKNCARAVENYSLVTWVLSNPDEPDRFTLKATLANESREVTHVFFSRTTANWWLIRDR